MSRLKESHKELRDDLYQVLAMDLGGYDRTWQDIRNRLQEIKRNGGDEKWIDDLWLMFGLENTPMAKTMNNIRAQVDIIIALKNDEEEITFTEEEEVQHPDPFNEESLVPVQMGKESIMWYQAKEDLIEKLEECDSDKPVVGQCYVGDGEWYSGLLHVSQVGDVVVLQLISTDFSDDG